MMDPSERIRNVGPISGRVFTHAIRIPIDVVSPHKLFHRSKATQCAGGNQLEIRLFNTLLSENPTEEFQKCGR